MQSELITTKSRAAVVRNSRNFVPTAKKIARQMAARYNQKKVAFGAANTSYHKKGSIDMSRIYAYKTSDDIFISKSQVNNAVSHGLVCAVDNSGSMSDIMPKVAMQFLITALYCKYIDIPFTMYTFTSDRYLDEEDNPWNEGIKGGIGDYKSRFTLIASEKMNESSIINSYYHIIAANTYRRGRIDYSRKYVNFLHRNFSMGTTPLINSALQSYCIAQHMKSRGTQNVTIMTISDGGNTDSFPTFSEEMPLHNTVECPFTKRVYSVNANHATRNPDGYYKNLLLSPINRMTREAGIKTFNLFLIDKVHSGRHFKHMTNSMVYAHDNNNVYNVLRDADLERYAKELNAEGMSSIENLSYYNKVIYADQNMFPKIVGKKVAEHIEDDDITGIIKASTKEIKTLSALGNIIADIMIQDFTYKAK